jgi:hypothetical protein
MKTKTMLNALGVADVELVIKVEVHEHGLRRQLLYVRHVLGENRHVLDRDPALAIDGRVMATIC